jgi:hypothetical protein
MVYGHIAVTLKSTQPDNDKNRTMVHTLQVTDEHDKKVGIDSL